MNREEALRIARKYRLCPRHGVEMFPKFWGWSKECAECELEKRISEHTQLAEAREILWPGYEKARQDRIQATMEQRKRKG